tara:strand:+ start:7345 stop:7848 length:504 start_codon:yes stop_codon:yes gene_type:complete
MANFINTTYLKTNTAIEYNVDDDKLVSFITKAQDIQIQGILGSDFYDYLQGKITANSNTFNADELKLMREYIQPALAEWTTYYVLPFLANKVTNKSVVKESSQWSNTSDLNELKYLQQTVRDMAEFYLERLTKYMCDNSTLFPVYVSATDDNMSKIKTTYFSGIYLD